MKDARLKDAVLADLLSREEIVNDPSGIDATKDSILQYIREWVLANTPEQWEDFATDILHKVGLYIKTSTPDKALKFTESIFKRDLVRKEKPLELVVIHDGHLAVRMPDVPVADEAQQRNLAKVLGISLRILGIKYSNLRILRDAKLGKSVRIIERLDRSISLLESALALPADQAGEAYEFECGFKANLPELLAAIKVSRRNSNLVRKISQSKAASVTADLLRKTFNMRFGFEESGADVWVVNYLKAIFAEATKPYTQLLPGEWIHSLRVRNNVNTDAGIMTKMGYVGISPAHIKVQQVVLTIKGKKTVHVPARQVKGRTNIGKGTNEEVDCLEAVNVKNHEEGIPHRDYRAAVVLLLPLISPKVGKPIKEQLSGDSLTPRSLDALEFYKKNAELVDALMRAFNIKVAIDKKSKTARPIHYESARNHLLNVSARAAFMDATGITYQKYTDIPEFIRMYLEKNFYRKIIPREEDLSLISSDKSPADARTESGVASGT